MYYYLCDTENRICFRSQTNDVPISPLTAETSIFILQLYFTSETLRSDLGRWNKKKVCIPCILIQCANFFSFNLLKIKVYSQRRGENRKTVNQALINMKQKYFCKLKYMKPKFIH